MAITKKAFFFSMCRECFGGVFVLSAPVVYQFWVVEKRFHFSQFCFSHVPLSWSAFNRRLALYADSVHS